MILLKKNVTLTQVGIFFEQIIFFLMEYGLVSMALECQNHCDSAETMMCNYIILDSCNNGPQYIMYLHFMAGRMIESSGAQLAPGP